MLSGLAEAKQILSEWLLSPPSIDEEDETAKV
jgi:hypothetical protein